MKKNIIYLVIAMILAATAYFFVYKKTNNTLSDKETNFAVEDMADVHKIFMADMTGNKITLEKRGDDWFINGRYPVRKRAMFFLLSTINKVKVKYPVPLSMHDNVVKGLSAHSTKVEIYDKEDNLLKTYYVGGPTRDNTGTYMILEGAGAPYVTYIPGFGGYLSTRYFVDAEEWRSRQILGYAPADIKYISVDYPGHAEVAFLFRVINTDSCEISRLHSDEPAKQAVSKDISKRYLSFFKNVHVEAFENAYAKKDSILSTTPYAVVTVKDITDKENVIKLYLRAVYKRTKMPYDAKGNPVKYDIDRLFASVNGGKDFAIVQWLIFDKILRKYPDFLVKAS